MNRELLIRAAALYMPITAALLTASLRRPRPREALSMLLSFLWCLCALLALQLINLRLDFWSYNATGGLFRGMPVDLYLGWAVLWGVLPLLTVPRMPLWMVMAIMAALDFLIMPLCAPVVALNRNWIVGEALALMLVLFPAASLARWTMNATHLPLRAAMLVALSAGVFLFLLPEIIFAATGTAGWTSLQQQSKYWLGVELQLAALLALLGVSAVQEFATRGGGTPIPFDPPKRLVTSGVYRYVANPMQLSSVLVLLSWGLMLEDWFVAAGGVVGLVYGVGIAGWDEQSDLAGRFGDRWRRYRAAVKPWLVRWRPWHDSEAPLPRLYIAETCGPCSEVRRWLERRNPVGLEIAAAEQHPASDVERITYDPGDGTGSEQGVAAFARALEHLNFAWAFCGFALRLPLLRPFVQLLLDASGLGPRYIPRREVCMTEGQRQKCTAPLPMVQVGSWQLSSYFWESRRNQRGLRQLSQVPQCCDFSAPGASKG